MPAFSPRRDGEVLLVPDRMTGVDALVAVPISHLVRDLNRAFSRSLQHRIAPYGVTIGQWYFLRALWEQDGLTQRELSQRVGTQEPTTVTAVNSMVTAGLVERVRNVHDRRKMNIFLTEKGRGLRDVLLPCEAAVERQALLSVEPGEVRTVVAVVERMIDNLDMRLD